MEVKKIRKTTLNTVRSVTQIINYMNKIFFLCVLLLFFSACSQTSDNKDTIEVPFKDTTVDSPVVSFPTKSDLTMNSELKTETEDIRILLTPSNVSKYSNTYNENYFGENFNFDPPTTSVTYENPEKGIRVELPYNPVWGSNNYRIRPYDVCIEECSFYHNTVLFGPIGRSEGGWTRHKYLLRFEAPKTAEKLLSDTFGSGIILPPYKTTINGLDVIKSADRGLMESFRIMIIGKNYDYHFAITGKEENMGELFMELEKIIETVELLD